VNGGRQTQSKSLSLAVHWPPLRQTLSPVDVKHGGPVYWVTPWTFSALVTKLSSGLPLSNIYNNNSDNEDDVDRTKESFVKE